MKNFYLRIKNETFLKSYLWLFLILIPFSSSFSQTFCRPVSQTNTTGGLLCVGMSVANPTAAFDGNLNTYALLTNVLGLACFAEETLTLNQTAKAGDQIVVYFGTGAVAGLVDVSLLSNATIQAKFSGTDVGGPVPLNNALLNLQLLPGNQVAVINYTLPGDANQIQIRVGGLVRLLVDLKIFEVHSQFASPTISGGSSQSVCSGQSIALSATAAAGTTLAWYDSPTSTTALSTTGNYSTPALTTTTTYYISVSRTAGCESDKRIPVTVNVINPVLPTISTVGTTICSSGPTQATKLSVINPIPGTTYSWFSVVTGGIVLATGDSYTPTVPTGITNFYVEASIGSCITPTRTLVTVTSTPVPALPAVLTPSVSIQSGQNATLSASVSGSGETLDWYDAPTGGTKLLANSTTFTTPILFATKTYYVESNNVAGGCLSASRVAVTVTVLPAPLGTCLEANSQQTTQNGLCLLCSVINPNNSVDGNTGTASTLSVPIGLVTGWIQQTLQFNNGGNTGDVIQVDLEIPTGILDISLLSYISLASYNGATYNNDRVAVNDALLNIQLLSGNRFRASFRAGASFDRVEIRLGGLATLVSSLNIYDASYKFKARTITGNTTICSGQTTTLVSDAVVGETIKWYDALTGGNLVSSTTSFTTPSLIANTTYYVEVTRNGCLNSERTPVVISINNPIAPTINTSGTTICAGVTTTLNIDTPVIGTIYKWYDAATAGTLVFTGTSFTTPILNANTSYYVEASIGSCISTTRTPVNVIVNSLPVAPTVASSTVTIQPGQNIVLQVSNPVVGVEYDWYTVPINGSPLLTNSNTFTPTPALTVNTTYYITARDAVTGCVSSTRTVLNVMIGSPIDLCLQPNDQTNRLSTLADGIICAVCAVNNPNNAIDGNFTTASNLNVSVGVGAFAEQVLSFSNLGNVGDKIDVELGIPAGLIDVSALSYITLATYKEGVYNNDRTAVNSNLINVQLLTGNRFKATFVAGFPFDAIEIRLGGVVTLLSQLDVYGVSIRYKDAVVTTSPVCDGQSATLAATPIAGTTFNWYDVSTGGVALVTNSDTYNTGVLTATKTYYLESVRGVCVNSTRQVVTATVLTIPTDTDITITSPFTASCIGQAVLAPTSVLAGAKFKYYTDQNKTLEITTGTPVPGQPGVTFLKDPVTDALTIDGLTGTSYNYYISVLNGGICENLNGTLKAVVVNYPVVSALNVTPTLAGCVSVNLKNAITDFDTTGTTTYTFFQGVTPITEQDAANITTGGSYWIQAQTAGVACPSVKKEVVVSINPLPTLTGVTNSIVVNKGNSIALTATSNGTVTWYDQNGNLIPSNNTGILNTVGIFSYTVIASNGTCTVSQTITISVIDPASCDSLLEREYASSQSWASIITGGVTKEANAADGNPSTFSTITTGVGLFGIGTTWQNLQWPRTITKGTPVTVKLGLENSLVAVGQSITVVGTKRNGANTPIDIGVLKSVSGSLLNLLSGQNSFEYTFVPSDVSGPKDYDGIRVQLGSILSVGQSINVYDAYYEKQVTQITCGQGDIQDVFTGVKDLGIGALTTTVGVSNPWNIADGDISTYATMFSGAGVLAAAELKAVFRTPSMVGDSLRITISKPGTVLNLNLLTGFTVQLYSGNIAVGGAIQNTSSLLSLRLLSGGTMAMTIVAPQTQPYDRVTITFGGVASVLDQLRVHTIDRVTNTKVVGGDINNKVTVCPGSNISLEVPEKPCADYAWYDSPIGGNFLVNGQTYTLPTALAPGIYKYYIQPIRYNCAALTRGEVIVEVRATTPANAIASVTINGETNTTICAEIGAVTLNAVLGTSPVLANPIYRWYSFDGTTSQLIAGQSASELVITGLVPGTYTYFVGVISDEFCETLPVDRKQVTFTILPTALQTDITVANASICHNTNAILTPTSALINPIFFWYLDANKTQPIIDGAIIGGVTYAISPAGVLTVSGLTKLMSPISFYVAVSNANTCQNKNGELKIVTVTVTDPATPTTNDTTQDFCLVNAPKVSDIQVNETGVVWYETLTGGVALAPTTALASGSYYAAIRDGVTGCESSVRLLVTVTVTDPATPTTNDTTQDFCLVNAPKVSDIQVNETGVVWYETLTGGVALALTTALNSASYYAAIRDGVTGCESSVRLLVTVTVTDPATLIINDKDQQFCLVNVPTVASINVSPANVANIIWYDALSDGNLISSGTALTSGNYYAAIKNPMTDCERTVRLLVKVTVNDGALPTTTRAIQDFCLTALPKISDLLVNETGVIWYTTPTGGVALAPSTLLVAGTYYGSLKNLITGCEGKSRLAIPVSFRGSEPATLTASKANPCVFDVVTYTTLSGMSNYNWTITGDGTVTAGGTTTDDFVTISWPEIGAASVNVSYSNLCNETQSKLLALTVQTCSDITMTNTVDNPTPKVNENVTFTITVNNIGSGNFIDVLVSELLPTGYDFVSAQTSNGIYNSTTGEWNIPILDANTSETLIIIAQVLPTGNYLNVASVIISNPIDSDTSNNFAEASVSPMLLVVYNEFTPNNDGANDFFKIDGIEKYPNNNLSVYNRYGALVYKQNRYNNDWDGTANVSGVINKGDRLPAGTYYYVLDTGADGAAKTGWIAIIR